MNFNLYNSLMLVGAVQGLIFASIVFLSKKYRKRSNYFLEALILCVALNVLQYYLLKTKILTAQEFFGIFYIPFSTLTIVIYYFYVLTFLYPERKISSKEKWLLLPFCIFFLLTLFYKICLHTGNLTERINQFFAKLIHIHEIFGCLFSLVLLLMIMRLLRRKYLVNDRESFSEFPLNQYLWLRINTIIYILFCVLWAVSIYINLFYGENEADFFYYFFWILSSFSIYWLGHLGIYSFGVAKEQDSIRKFSMQKTNPIVKEVKQNEHIKTLQQMINRDKIHLDNNITLESVAEKLNLNKSYLSRLINSELKMNFSDYLNSVRVEEAKSYISNPEFSNYTLVAIGLEAGFNSKSAFNNAFKKFTGLTPSEYRKSLAQNISVSQE